MNKFRTAAVALVLVMAFCLPAMAAELRLAQVADELRAEGKAYDARQIDLLCMHAKQDVKTFERWVRHEHSFDQMIIKGAGLEVPK